MSDALKHALRARFRHLRRDLEPAQREAETAATVAVCQALITELRPPALASYCATAPELDLDALHAWCWRSGAKILMPRVVDAATVTWHPLSSAMALRPGAHGIREPDPALVAVAPLPMGTLVFVPGLAFAVDGRRLGQGGGYYDRVLASTACTSVGVGFSCQRCDDLPTAAHDQRLDGVVLGGDLMRSPPRRAAP